MEPLKLVIACWRVLDAWDGRKSYRDFSAAMTFLGECLPAKGVEPGTTLEAAAMDLYDVWASTGRYHEFLTACTKVRSILNDIEQARHG